MSKKSKPSSVSKRKPVYFMAAVLAVYERDETTKQRHINVLLEADTLNLTKAHLAQVQKSSMARLHAENNVEPSNVKDVIILNISFLGQMTEQQFHGADPVETVQ
jgi:hypothetical protein